MRIVNDKQMIFCIGCRWLIHEETDNVLEEIDYDCRYPSNVTVRNSWLCSDEIYMKKPSEINQNNNCEWFASKYREKWKKSTVKNVSIFGHKNAGMQKILFNITNGMKSKWPLKLLRRFWIWIMIADGLRENKNVLPI